MVTLFGGKDAHLSSTPTGVAVALYALAGTFWLGLAIANFHRGHSDRAWLQLVTAVLFLISMTLNLSRWKKERRAS